MALYLADDGVTPVTTQSMIKAFRQCPREAYYKYVLRLKPKVRSLQLTRGKWMHSLLEAYYKEKAGIETEPWRTVHDQLTSDFRKLFDEEKEKLGDLPTECLRLFEAYLWHYHGDESWKVHELELTLEAELPNGHLFRCRIDALVEDDYGLLIGDHKTHKKLPDWDSRMLDDQSPLYIWAAWQNNIPVRGFVWNYIRTAGISVPKVLQDGTRFYKREGDSDYPTYARAVKAALAEYPEKFLKGKNAADDKAAVKSELARLKAQRFEQGAMQTSPHFRRDTVEKSKGMIDRALAAAVRTSDRMHSYDFSNPDQIERNSLACKGFFCSYADLSLVDLVKGDSEMIMKRMYRSGEDPLAYYEGEER